MLLFAATVFSEVKFNFDKMINLNRLGHDPNKTRFVIDTGDTRFTIDNNEDRSSWYNFKAWLINNEETKLIVVHSGIWKEVNEASIYEVGIVFNQKLFLPFFGDSNLYSFTLGSFQKDNNALFFSELALFGENIDLYYKGFRTRDLEYKDRYYLAIHKGDFYMSAGKGQDKFQGVIITPEPKDFGLCFLIEHNWETEVTEISTTLGLSEVNPSALDLDFAKEASKVLTIGVLEISRPIWKGYLVLGRLCQQTDIKFGPDFFEIKMEFGGEIFPNLSLGGGFFFQTKDKETIFSPSASGMWKIPLSENVAIHIEGNWRNGNASALTKMAVSF